MRKKFTGIQYHTLGLATLMLLLWACDLEETLNPGTPGDTAGTALSGRVLDYQTHRGVPGVQLHVPQIGTVVTDEEGFYRLDNAIALSGNGPLTISAQAGGYHPAAVIVDRDAIEVTIPVLYLRPIAPMVYVGPAGGILEAEGVRVRIPAGALAEPTALSVAITRPRAVAVESPRIFRGVMGIEVRPAGIRFARPVEVTVALPTVNPPGRHLPLYKIQDSNLDSVGVATVSNDGRSAWFILDEFPQYDLELPDPPFYNRTGPTLQHTAWGTRTDFNCGASVVSVGQSEGPAFNVKVPDYQNPMFSSNALRYSLNAIGSTTTGNITINAGDPYKLVMREYVALYAGSETGVYDPGNGAEIIDETIAFSLKRNGVKFEKKPCHLQGGSK